VLLGAAGAWVISAGGVPFLAATLFVVYHATQEYFGMATSRGAARGDEPPPPAVAAATTALCLSIAVLTHALGVRCGTALCVASFLLLALNIVAAKRPSFSGLTSSVFGLFYCGEQRGGARWHFVRRGGRRASPG
jgi:hypothetical protein